MFFNFHRKTWFPFIVLALSLSLGLFIVWSFVNKENNPTANFPEAPAITSGQYQNEAKQIVKDFWLQFEAQTDDAARLFFTSEVEQKLLALRVPAEDRSVHFELVSSLELLRQGLVGDVEKLEAGKTRLQKVFSDNLWLTK